VYAIDLPGFGRSSRTPFKGKSPQEAEEFFLSAIEKWRKEMQLNESFTLLGTFIPSSLFLYIVTELYAI
jgi:pimeloyl-ACP methyl ester carboxylesterase